MLKKKLLIIIGILALGAGYFFYSSSSQDLSNYVTEKYVIEGMTCESCSVTISKTLKKNEAIKDVFVSFKENQATITYDPHKASPSQIKKIIESEGYKATRENKGKLKLQQVKVGY